MSQHQTAGGNSKVLGILLIIVGGGVYIASGGAEGSLYAFLSIPLMAVGFFLQYRGRQKAAKAMAEGPQSALFDSKPDVLYLRSFHTDPSSAYTILQSALTTSEEELAYVLRPFGDLVAIGQPGERFPVPGATRMYAGNGEWQQVVIERLKVAPLVVIRAGSSEGLLWEVGQAIKLLPPKRVLIFVLDITVQDYTLFADRVRTSLGLNLPSIEAGSLMRALIDRREGPSKARPGFIMFSDDWSAEFLPLPPTIIRTGYNDFRKSFSTALRQVFERNGVPWRAAGRFG